MEQINHNSLRKLEAARGKKCKITYILEGFPNEEYTGVLRAIEVNQQTKTKTVIVDVKGVCIHIATDRIVSLAVSA